MLVHLLQAGLPHIDDGQAIEMVLPDLRRGRGHAQRCSWLRSHALLLLERGRVARRVKAGHAPPPCPSGARAGAGPPHDAGRAALAPDSATGVPTTIGSGLRWLERLSG